MLEDDTATFAAGCFWGVEAAFSRVKGVLTTRVGYTGGHTECPTYEDVCSHTTGHAEAVELTFDPAVVTYEQLLDTFWAIHDPTTKNRQGPDIGDQYRSAIFYHSETQKAAAVAAAEKLAKSGKYRRPIVTEIAAASKFWPAEEYHQKYFEKHGDGSCHVQ
jgi:peptide-methionine (S)-S-oxide reductase